jgi:uncharacterized membrane protein YraQ (UPF0718 family)
VLPDAVRIGWPEWESAVCIVVAEHQSRIEEIMNKGVLRASLTKTALKFVNLIPIIIGMLLLSSLVVTAFPEQLSTGLFGNSDFLDTLIGVTIGSVAAGHPLASYLMGGELLKSGVSLIAVTAFVVSWVTVGIAQLPAEMLMLGARFAIYRNLICYFGAIAVAYITVYTLKLLG